MSKLVVVDHPMVKDSLTHLRCKDASRTDFRRHSDRICEFLFYEAVSDLQLREVEIETPLEKTQGQKLSDEVVVVPVLRSGLALLPAALKFLPKSRVGFVGFERDEVTAQARRYYWKLPKIASTDVVIITDPMLATGGTSEHVLEAVAETHPGRMIFVSVIAAPEGVERITKRFPDVQMYTAALDDHLNDQKYIVPGLGDYGDRYFGTE